MEVVDEENYEYGCTVKWYVAYEFYLRRKWQMIESSKKWKMVKQVEKCDEEICLQYSRAV